MKILTWIRSSFRHRIFTATMLAVLLPVLLCSILIFSLSFRRSRLFLREHAENDLTKVAGSVHDLDEEICKVTDFLRESTLVRSTLRYEAWNSYALYSVLLKRTHNVRRYADFSIVDKTGVVRFSTANQGEMTTSLPLNWGILRLARESRSLQNSPLRNVGSDAGNPAVSRTTPDAGIEFVSTAGENGGIDKALLLTSHDGTELGYLLVHIGSDPLASLLTDTYTAGNDVFLFDPFMRLIYSSERPTDAALLDRIRSELIHSERIHSAEGDYSAGQMSENGRNPLDSVTAPKELVLPESVKNDAGDNASYNYAYTEIPGTGITAVLQQPKLFTTAVTQTLLLISGSIALTGLILGLFTTWNLSRHISEPILELDHAMKQAMNGDYSVRVTSSRTDEMGHLTRSFNHMLEEHANNLERSVQHQKELNEAQIRMLQAQLNPHFLYNTLDTMKWLGVAHHVPDVASLSTSLAALLRAGISDSRLITLDEELDLVDRYLAIQSIRFEDRFTCEIDVDERFRGCLIPKLVLQPVVENAVVHGVANKDEGYIKITAEERFEDASRHVLVLTVSDNGAGMPEDILRIINSGGSLKPRGHLGCYNVGRIIRLYYGESYGLFAASKKGVGTTITLRLPMETEAVST